MSFNIVNYGASPSVADNNSAVQAAISACQAAGGGEVLIPNGTYRYKNQLVVSGNNVTIRGEGDGSVLQSDDLTSSGITAYAGGNPVNDLVLKDFNITATARKTSGAALALNKVGRPTIENVKVCPVDNNGWTFPIGIQFNGFDDARVDNCVVNCFSRGIAANGYNDQSWGADLWIGGGSKITNVRIPSDFANGQIGVLIGGAVGGLVFDECDIIFCDTGVQIDTSLAGVINREIFFSLAFIDSSGANGVVVLSNSVNTLQFANTWIASSGIRIGGFPNGNGVNIAPGQSGSMTGVATGCRIFNNQGTGFACNGGEWNFTGNAITDNGQAATVGGDGLGIYNQSVRNLVVCGNTITRNGRGQHGAGLHLQSGLVNHTVTGNSIRENGLINLADNTGSVNKIVANNLTG